MSAGRRAEVLITDLKQTYALSHAFVKGRDVSRSSLTLLVDGERTEGWTFFSKDSNGIHNIFLRHTLDEAIGTAMYVHLALPRDESSIEPTQAIVIQNDNDYKGRGNDRFVALHST